MEYIIFDGGMIDPSEFIEDEEEVSPVNIRTALYALFLIAKDHTEDKRSITALDKAIVMIDNICDDEIFHAFGDVFPPDDLSIENIIKIAHSVKSLHNVISKHSTEQTQEQFEKKYNRVVRIIDKAFLSNQE